MAASHSGEDVHVRTLQAVFRRAGVSQTLLTCGNVGMPMDKIDRHAPGTRWRAPGAIRHHCSGFHTASLLLSRHADWSLADYGQPDHPSQHAVRDVVAGCSVSMSTSSTLRTTTAACGTYAFPLVDVARAYALLADPASASDPLGRRMAPALRRVRDAMTASPEMVGGTKGCSTRS